MVRSFLLALSLAVFPNLSFAQADPCSRDAPCEIADGSYHLVLPESWDGESPLPAIVFFHGHRGSGASIFRSQGLNRSFAQNGYLLIAPNGAIRPGTNYRAWPARPGNTPRDDVAFTLGVLDDVAKRVPLDTGRVYASGFSAGGSMAWMMGCYAGDRFAGVASVAGALRRPLPEGHVCPSPVARHIQVHGFSDQQVPLEGRGIRDWHQGDVFEALDMLRQGNACRSRPDAFDIGDKFWCRDWTSCETGRQKLCLHDGGHGLPAGWTDLALEFFETE